MWPRLARRTRILAFAAAYAAMVAICFAGWRALSRFSLTLFLALAVLHFGQSGLRLSAAGRLPSRGCRRCRRPPPPWVSPPRRPWTQRAVLAAMTDGGLDATWASAPWIAPPRAVIIGSYLAAWALPRVRADRDRLTLAEECCLLLTLTVAPAPWFSLYFGLFHGPAHLRAVFEQMRSDAGGAPLRRRIARVWWTCALALGGVAAAGLWWATSAGEAFALDGLTAGLLVMLASLTVPHAALVAAIEARRRWHRAEPRHPPMAAARVSDFSHMRI